VQPEETRPSWPRWVLTTLLVWIAACLVMGAIPITDTVPTGAGPDGVRTFEDITCHSALSTSNAPDEPLPELDPPREYEREPCRSAHSQTRLMLWIDVILALAGVAIVTRKLVQDRRHASNGAPALTP
jgi:hypothetical protein